MKDEQRLNKKIKTFGKEMWIVLLLCILGIFGPRIIDWILSITSRKSGLTFFIYDETIETRDLLSYYVLVLSMMATATLGAISYRINKNQNELILGDRSSRPQLEVFTKNFEVHYPFEKYDLLLNRGTETIERLFDNITYENIFDLEEVFHLNNANRISLEVPLLMANKNRNDESVAVKTVTMTIKNPDGINTKSESTYLVNRTLEKGGVVNKESKWFNFLHIGANDAIERVLEFKFSNNFDHYEEYNFSLVFDTNVGSYKYDGTFVYEDFRVVLFNSKDKIQRAFSEAGIKEGVKDFTPLALLKGYARDKNNPYRYKLSNSYRIDVEDLNQVDETIKEYDKEAGNGHLSVWVI